MQKRTFAIRNLVLSFLFVTSVGVPGLLAVDVNGTSGPQVQAGLKHNLVCMVNDAYMGKEQIPVEIDGKTYYGCCKGCEENLKTNRDARYAKDPATGSEVDKATAFIVKLSELSDEVSYFESRETYEAFVQSIHGHNSGDI